MMQGELARKSSPPVSRRSAFARRGTRRPQGVIPVRRLSLTRWQIIAALPPFAIGPKAGLAFSGKADPPIKQGTRELPREFPITF